MLFIRTGQHAKLSEYQKQLFKKQLAGHLETFFPFQTWVAGKGSVALFVEMGVEQAMADGFDTRATVQSYLDHMVLLGMDFCQNPLYADIVAPLWDKEIDDLVERHDRLYDLAWDYLDKTRGPDAAGLFKAVIRLRAWLSDSGRQPASDTGAMVLHLAAVFPEKAAAHTPQTLALFCGEALRKSRDSGFVQSGAQTLYTTAAFLAGLGFSGDPLCTGAAPEQVKALVQATEPDERSGLLAAWVSLYLDKMIQAAGLTNL